MMLDCTATIVTYNQSPEMLQVAIDSFLSCSLKKKLYIVDNSPKADLQIYFHNTPIEYYFYGENVGYGKAHNWAINRSKDSHYHIIINPDIVISPGAIEKLLLFMNENESVGMVCPRVLNEDGSDQFLNKRYPNLFDLFSRRFIPKKIQSLFKKRLDHYEMKDVGYGNICDVEIMSGAFMVCRKSVLKALGGFDPRYFLYFEDFDLSRKFQTYGYRTVYYPYATVIHHWERAAHKSLKMALVFTVNMFRYFNKWGWKFF